MQLTRLFPGIKNSDIFRTRQSSQNNRSFFARHFVRPHDSTGLPVRPINEVTVQGQREWLQHSGYDDSMVMSVEVHKFYGAAIEPCPVESLVFSINGKTASLSNIAYDQLPLGSVQQRSFDPLRVVFIAPE